MAYDIPQTLNLIDDGSGNFPLTPDGTRVIAQGLVTQNETFVVDTSNCHVGDELLILFTTNLSSHTLTFPSVNFYLRVCGVPSTTLTTNAERWMIIFVFDGQKYVGQTC